MASEMLALLRHIPASWAPYTRIEGACVGFILCAMLTSVGLLVQKTKKASAKISVIRKYESSDVNYGLYISEFEVGLTLSS